MEATRDTEYTIEKTAINDVVFMRLKIVETPGGDVLRMLRKDSPMLSHFPQGFGEIYFSEVLPGAVKAWKMHKEQIGLMAVPMGRIKMVLYDGRPASFTLGALAVLDLGRPDTYRLLRIPAGIWYGFKCVTETPALICNCADVPHDPADCVRVAADDPQIPFKW